MSWKTKSCYVHMDKDNPIIDHYQSIGQVWILIILSFPKLKRRCFFLFFFLTSSMASKGSYMLHKLDRYWLLLAWLIWERISLGPQLILQLNEVSYGYWWKTKIGLVVNPFELIINHSQFTRYHPRKLN